MAGQFGLSASELQARALSQGNGFFDIIEAYETLLSDALGQANIDDVNPWSWELGHLDLDERQRLSDRLFQQMGISDEELRIASRREGSAFNVFRESATFEHGFGSLAMGDTPLSTKDEIFARLFYTTSNIQIRGEKGAENFIMRPRYKSNYLMQQAQNIEEMISGEFFKDKKMFVLDTETAGFSMRSGVWQIAGRTANNVEGQIRVTPLEAVGSQDAAHFASDAVVENKNMMKGMTVKDGQPIRLTDLFETMQSEGRVDASIIDAIDRMGDQILESHYIMGQNLSFDMPRISHDIRKALDDVGADKSTVTRMTSILDHLENNVRYVDTQVLAQHIFQGTGQDAIKVASELMKKDKYTPFSIANIMLETNFLDLLAEDLTTETDDGWKIINKMLMGEGSHDARVDTFMTAHLGRIEAEHIAGADEARRLRPKRLADKTLRNTIVESSAWTPYTKEFIDGTEMRPIEYMVQHMRQMNRNMGRLNRSDVFFNAGVMSDWAESMLTPEGYIRDPEMLYDSDFTVGKGRFGKPIRDIMMDEGLEIGRYSPLEALISTKISELAPGRFADSKLKNLVGDVMQSATLERSMGIEFKGRSQRNVAMSMEMLEWAEQAGVLPEGTVTGEFVSARWSTVRGPKMKGLALVADVFERGDKGKDQIAQFKEEFAKHFDDLDDAEFQSRFGMSKAKARYAVERLSSNNAIEHGVQLGFIKDDETGAMDRLLTLLESEELGLDNKDAMQLRTHAYMIKGDDKNIYTGLSYLETPDTVPEQIATSQRRVKEVTEMAVNELSKDPVKKTAIGIRRGRGKDAVKRIFDFMGSTTAKGLGIGGLVAGAGYYLHSRKEEQDPYDESMEFGGWETGSMTGRTRFERSPSVHGSLQPLSTAGVVRELDYNKIRHDNMSPDKYSHLYRG